MKHSLLVLSALLAAAPAVASISVDVTSLTFTTRAHDALPAGREFPPQKALITVTSSGNWSWATSSSLTTPCTSSGFCFKVTGQFNGTAIVSGVTGVPGTTVVAVNWFSGSQGNMAAGTYMGTITFTEGSNNVVVPVTVTQQTASVFPTVTELMGTSLGASCTKQVSPAGSASYAGVCAIPNEPPMTNPSVTQPDVGHTYVDPSFGNHTITRVTDNTCATQYGGTTAFSATSQYLLTSCGIYRLSDLTLIRPATGTGHWPSGFSELYGSMSPIDDQIAYYFNGPNLYKYNFVTNATPTVLFDYSAAPYNLTSIDTGSTQGISEDNWISFFDGGRIATPFICSVNLTLLASEGTATNNNTYCATWSNALAPGFPTIIQEDWTQTTEVDSVTHERFVILSANLVSTVFAVGPYGSGTLIQKFITPEQNTFSANNYNGFCESGETCGRAAEYTHGVACQDSDGQIKWEGAITNSSDGVEFRTWNRLSSGLLYFRQLEQGGGMALYGLSNYDTQPFCSARGHFWSWGYNPSFNLWYSTLGTPTYSAGNVTFTPAQTITWAPITVVSTGDITIDPSGHFQRQTQSTSRTTGASAPSWNDSGGTTADGNAAWQDLGTTMPVLIANAESPWACLNGNWTASPSGLGSISVPAAGCTLASGVISARTLVGYAGVDPGSGVKQDRGQLQVWKPGKQMQFVAFHRGVSWVNKTQSPIIQYYTQLRSSGSRDGRYLAFNSNWGSLDNGTVANPTCSNCNTSVYIVATGISSTSSIASVSIQPAATNALLAYSVSTGAPCSIEVSATSGFSTLLRTISDVGASTSRQVALGALTASTNYWARWQCGVDVESVAFSTLPAISPTTRTVTSQISNPGVANLDNVVLDYRSAGDVSWASATAVPCVAGCSVAWPGPVGIAEYRYNWRNSSNAVLATTSVFSIQVNQ